MIFLHILFTKANILILIYVCHQYICGGKFTICRCRACSLLCLFTALHMHMSAYSLCTSGHKRVLEYLLSYFSSTRVTNYSVSAALIHIHTHTYHDKVIVTSMSPYYVVDNKLKQEKLGLNVAPSPK